MPDLLFALWLAAQSQDTPPDDDDDDDDDDEDGGGLPVEATPPQPRGWPPRIRLALPSGPRPAPLPGGVPA